MSDEELKRFGFDLEGEDKSGSFALSDDLTLVSLAKESGLEVMPISDALKLIPEVKEKYWWKLLSPDEDEITRKVAGSPLRGLFARIKKGKRIVLPMQACYILRSEAFSQVVHNVIVAEEGAEIHLITGCLTSSHVSSGYHYSVTEIFIEKGAFLTYSMFHSWAPDVEVYPKSVALIEEGGKFISNYVCLREVKYLETYPKMIVKDNGVARSYSVVYAPSNSFVDIGSKLVLEGNSSKGESISRSVSSGGKIIARASVEGRASNCRGHVECHGVILTEGGFISAVPELIAFKNDVDLSHEAAVGRLSEDEILYLQARGLSEDEAKSLIVRGFMKVEIEGLPEELKREMDRIIDMTFEGGEGL